MLDEMKVIWKDVKFDLKPYPDNEDEEPVTFTIRTFDDIFETLDEHI
jgi:hypothetical protein